MDANIVVTQVSSAAAVVYILQKLKDWDKFVWLKHEGQIWLKRGLSLGAAFGIHTGISYVWNPTPTPDGQGHVLAITIPPMSIVLVGLWHWFNQYVLQELIYQGTVNKVSVTTDAAGSIPARVAPSGAVVVPAAAAAEAKD